MNAAAPSSTTVLLVDDHALIREGLAGVIALEDDLHVVGQAGSVAEALRMFDELRPDVVLTDLQMQDGTGLDLLRAIRATGDPAGVVIVTMHCGDDQIFAAMNAGASGFVGKDAPAREVLVSLRHAAAAPGAFICSGLVGAIGRHHALELSRLSERENDVLLLLAEGLAAQTIGDRLYLSESTVKMHIARIYQKLGASNRAQAMVTAMRVGLLSSLCPA